MYFWSNKCSLDEHETSLKNIENLPDPQLLNAFVCVCVCVSYISIHYQLEVFEQ